MVFPDNDYITFTIDSKNPVNFTFPKKKPKKIWLDAGGSSVAFRLKINDDSIGILIHMTSGSQKNFELPSTINSISLSTASESVFFFLY